MLSMVNHNIDHNTYAKIGETLLRWAEADGYLGNSINWMSGFPPNSAEAKDVYKLAMKDKVKSLEKCRDSRRGTTTKDIDTLLEDIRQVMNLEWKKERDSIAHGTPLQLKNGAVVLRTDKGYEFRIDHVDVALMHARCISNLAVQLNVRLAAPVTKNIFPIRGMLLLLWEERVRNMDGGRSDTPQGPKPDLP